MPDSTDALIFGTMRLGSLSGEASVALLSHLLAAGVRRFHSSTEYESFEPYVEAIGLACRETGVDPASLRHVVKVASPHFGEDSFSASDLTKRLRHYGRRLGAEKLDVVQWMVRHDLADEPGRLDILNRSSEAIGEAVASLKDRGLIGRFGCFPYTAGLRRLVIAQPWCDVLVDYLNPLETDCRTEFSALRTDQSVIAIRPLLPLQDPDSDARRSVDELLGYALSDPIVEAVVVGTGSIEHADGLLAGLARLRGAAPTASCP